MKNNTTIINIFLKELIFKSVIRKRNLRNSLEIVLLIVSLFEFTNSNAQKWGLYTLYSVKGTNTAQLIDTNSNIYKTWTFPTNSKTGFSSYLIPGDTLVRVVNYPANIITGSSATGEVQKVDWNNNIVWDYVYSDTTTVLHHDICPMPNGNVLMLALDITSAADMVQAGSSSSTVRNMDKIIEVHPTGPNTGTIVWEWKDWDHLCQNYDASKNNYVSSIVMNPQLLNINHSNSGDFTHMNGIDYNAALDQIAISSFTFSEVFVIDHSTTTAQAAGHTGGNSGHGGDIIYRWGNPASYGASGTHTFYVVHDAHWVPADNPYYPNYLCGFNNDGGTGGRSAVDIFLPPYNGYNYNLTLGSAYGPSNYSWLYTADTTTTNEGNSQQFPNGNSLVCLTFADSIIEVNQSGTILWRFNPGGKVSKAYRYSKCRVRGPIASASASSTQITSGMQVTLNSSATSITETNQTYTYSWSSVPAGFTSSSQNPNVFPTSTTSYIVTITNTSLGCSDTASVKIFTGTTGVSEQASSINFCQTFPNPTNSNITFQFELNEASPFILTVYNSLGQLITTVINDKLSRGMHTYQWNAEGMPVGIYSYQLKTDKQIITNKIILLK